MTTELERELTAALAHDDLEAVIAALAKRGSGALAVGADPGTAKVADIALAARLIRSKLRSDRSALFAWTQRLLTHVDFNAHQVGLILLSEVYEHKPGAALRLLKTAADSDNWAVREYAGTCAGRILNAHFAEVYEVMTKWAQDKSENVRRAVVIATMEAAKANEPKRGAKLLKLIEPLMGDDSRYVRVNLGPFAISLALLKNYPELTLKFLKKHASCKNEYGRWNVAMVWSAVGGRKYAADGARLLDQLAADERRFVWRAVASAAVKLGKARPDVIKPLLMKWQSDPKRQHVAAVAKRYL